MRGLFIDKHGSYRIGWRIIFAIAIFVAASLVSIIIASVIYQNVKITSFSSMISDTMDTSWGNALASLVLILLLCLALRLISNGRKNYWNDLGFANYKPVTLSICGFVCGALFVVSYVVPLSLANMLKIEFAPVSPAVLSTLVAGLIIYAGVAFSEELIFRGYIQGFLTAKYKEWGGILITSLLFAAVHLMNASYTPISLLYLFAAGLAFSLMRIVTKGLWFPIGFHLAYDWVELTIFGVSTDNPGKRWFFTSVEMKTIWTGNDGFSGLAVVLVLLLIVALLMFMKIKRKHI